MSQSTSRQPVVPLAETPLAQVAVAEAGSEEPTVLLDTVPAADQAASPPVVHADPVTLAALYGGDQQAARLYAADVLRAILNEAPTPSGITLHTKDYEPTPRIEVHLFHDADLVTLRVYQGLYGGEIVRDEFESGAVRHSFTTEVFGVPVYVSTILLAPRPAAAADVEAQS